MHDVTDAANFFGRADLHGAFRHMDRRPEFILVAVRIGEINDGAFVAFGGCRYRLRVRDFVLIEPPQVQVDILGPDIESAARQIFTQSFCRRVDLGLKKCADAA